MDSNGKATKAPVEAGRKCDRIFTFYRNPHHIVYHATRTLQYVDILMYLLLPLLCFMYAIIELFFRNMEEFFMCDIQYADEITWHLQQMRNF